MKEGVGWSGDIRAKRQRSLYLRFREKITRHVRILMIAPEPFFEPRGTPFSEFHRIRALTALGHQVDLVTYPFGADVAMPGLRVFRSLRPPFVRGVEIGPSAAKLPLDALLALTACRRALGGRYDAVHSHEEGGAIGVVLATLLRVPHLYDMHSSLPQQLTNFAFSGSRLVRGVFAFVERLMIRRSRAVIVICPSLEETVRAIDPRRAGRPHRERAGLGRRCGHAGRRRGGPRVVRLRRDDAARALHRDVRGVSGARSALRRRWRSSTRPGRTRACSSPAASPRRCRRRREQARAAGLADVAVFAGERPAAEIPAYLAGGRRPGVAAVARHEHAAEDLPVPPVGPADRRDPAADPHAGPRRRHGVSDRRLAARVRRRHPRGARRSRRARRRGAARPRARRNQVQLRGLPGEDAAGLRGAVAGAGRRRRREGRKGVA